jgi:hypothetical protein
MENQKGSGEDSLGTMTVVPGTLGNTLGLKVGDAALA